MGEGSGSSLIPAASCKREPSKTGEEGYSSLTPAMSQAVYDVFIIFSREDTGNNFSGHLLAALCRRGISVFKGFDGIFTEEQPNQDVVEKSRVCIIIFSKNFGSSFHCLNDVVKILECQQRSNQVVVPVFYQASPSDMLNEMERFAEAFQRLGNVSMDQVMSWRTALREIIQMPVYALADRSEADLIDEIVRDVCKTLSSRNNENLIGMDLQLEQLLSLLCIQSPDVRSLGIWGMGGIGKTTIAKEILHRVSGQYEGSFFLEDFHGLVKIKGLDSVREEFFSRILDVETHILRTSNIETSFLRSRLQNKRVLVVLDNLNDFKDLETLVGKLDRFGPGSRIIITSRSRRVLVRCKVNDIYEVKPLDFAISAQLFCHYAFASTAPWGADWKHSLDFVKIAEGNPLILKVLGLFLQGKPRHEWGSLSQKFRQNPPNEIRDMLERSYCGLDDNEKCIFLDIACFFRGKDKDNVAALLDGCGSYAHVGISGLVDKSLITISDKKLDMHKLIQDMGRNVVHRESANPGCRSRLWNPSDIRNIFNENAGSAAIEGIFLDMSKLIFDTSPTVFEKMYNLRLLKLYFSEPKPLYHGVLISQGLEYLPSKLHLLHWEDYPLSSLPWNFDPKNLVELNLPNSRIEKLWKGTKNLEKLKKMRLSYSHQLLKIPRLSRAQNLEHIDLEGCKSLVKISSSVCHLKELVSLSLKDCSGLWSLPSMLHLRSLEVLNLSGCSGLEIFPEISRNVKEIYLGGTAIREVPSSIKNLAKLVKLDMECSGRLENLPSSICKLKYLEILNLSGCSRLESFPELSRNMKNLWLLDLSGTAIKALPSSFLFLICLQELRLVNCRNLAKLPDNLSSLKSLRKVKLHEAGADISNSGKEMVGLEGLSSYPAGASLHFVPSLNSLALRFHSLVNMCLQNTDLLEIPEDLCGLPSLNILDLSANVFQKLPENITRLSKLESLRLGSCKCLESIPVLPRSVAYLDAHGCKSLEKVSWILERSPAIPNNCLDLSVEMLSNDSTDALMKSQNKQKQEFQVPLSLSLSLSQSAFLVLGEGNSKASSLTICFPENALPKLLNFVNAKSYTHLVLPYSWLNSNLLGLAFFVVVAFEKHYHNESDFAIRCICNVKFPNGAQHTLEKYFYCWTHNQRETRIRGDHICIFYDYSMLEPLVEKNEADIEAYFSFYPVDGHNRLLAGCKVKSCAVLMLTPKHEMETNTESAESEFQDATSITDAAPIECCASTQESRSEVTDEAALVSVRRFLDLDKSKRKYKRVREDSTSTAGAAPIQCFLSPPETKFETSSGVTDEWNSDAALVDFGGFLGLAISKKEEKRVREDSTSIAKASPIEVEADWRKYGMRTRQAGSINYYRCRFPNCQAKKVERSHQGRIVEVRHYDGHTHHIAPLAQQTTMFRLFGKQIHVPQDLPRLLSEANNVQQDATEKPGLQMSMDEDCIIIDPPSLRLFGKQIHVPPENPGLQMSMDEDCVIIEPTLFSLDIKNDETEQEPASKRQTRR